MIRLKVIDKFIKENGYDVDLVLTPTIQDRIAVTDGKIMALNANILKEEKSIIIATTHELIHINDKSTEHSEDFRKKWIQLTLKLSAVMGYTWNEITVTEEITKIEFLFSNMSRLTELKKNDN